MTHTKPDFLSRPPGLDKGENDNKNIILLPEHHFCTLHLRLQGAEYLFGTFPEAIKERLSRLKQDEYDKQALKGLNTNDIHWIDHRHRLVTYKDRIYIPASLRLRTDLIHEHHDTVATGHPG